MYATIQPVQVFPSTASVLYINNVSVRPGASASFQWWLQSDEGTQLTQGTLSLDGAEYQAWNSDDYLYTFTASKIGVVIVQIIEDVAEVTPAAEAPVVAPAVDAPAAEAPVDAPVDPGSSPTA